MNTLLDPFKSVARAEASQKIASIQFPETFPYPAASFNRMDPRPDATFYKDPRLLQHIDEAAQTALTKWYATHLPKNPAIHLDLCSSWVSHLPENYKPAHVVGIGMSDEELRANPRLHEFHVRDLNATPSLEGLGMEKGTVDACTVACSVDYLTKPLEVFQEIKDYLRPDGLAVMSFSNRCFPQKVVTQWLKCNDAQRMVMVSSYFHFTGYVEIQAVDATQKHEDGTEGDPMLIVHARKPK